MFKNILRALRVPFITASVLPFIFGSLIKRENFNFWGFILGLIAAASTHLSANLINDYADSKSQADWQDKKFYGFFGGSKLIQENILSEKFYLRLALFFALCSLFSVALLFVNLKTFSVIFYFLAIILLGWSYSTRPLRFSYHRMGEIIIFILFGPAVVMGGYFIQTRVFPDLESLILSLPFGFFTTAILFANEIPDFTEDKKVGKYTWVDFLGAEKSYLLYLLLIALGAASLILGITRGYLGGVSIFSLIFIYPAIKATYILKKYHTQKTRLIESSKLTIAVQILVSIVLILDRLLCIKL